MSFEKGVSVIIPVLNAEKYIDICIVSLIKQTFKDIELIFVIDKNSVDNSENIIQKYSQEYNNIHVIKSDYAGGAGYNRLLGIESATKEFIGFVDADDCVSENYYEILFANAVKNNADVAIADTIMLDENKKVISASKYEFKILNNFCEIYNTVDYSTVWDKIYRSELLKDADELLFPTGVIHEDNLFTLKVLYSAKKIITVENAHYFWYRNNDSVTNLEKNYQKCLEDAVTVFNQVIDVVKELNLTNDEKYAIINHNLENYAGLLFKAKYKNDYFRQKLISVLGISKTYEILMAVNNK